MLSLFLMISIVFNYLLIVKNKELKLQLEHLKFRQMNKKRVKNTDKTSHALTVTAKPKINQQEYQFSELEVELNNDITLDDIPYIKLKNNSQELIQSSTVSHQENLLYTALQALSGWRDSFIPFLLQNIGWFIGILCFISGSIFFVSYTEGFSKSLTTFYTILSYTLLLTWSGYYLKEKVKHASTSGMVLLAISFLLVPLNFSAAGRLLTISFENGLANIYSAIAAISVLIASILLFYITKLISGLFNRQLLNNFSPVFFSLSAIQLLVPVVHNSQSLTLVLIQFVIIIILLLLAFIYYLPIVLKQVFVDKKYLVLFSVGTLIFSALVSMIHISLSSPVDIALSYYAPLIMIISMVLFYMDEQLNAYREQGSLLSCLSIISYTLSFAAIFLSFDSAMIRPITMTLSIVLYTRLMWLYRSLVPLYLVISVLSILYADIFLLGQEFKISISLQYLYISLLPLISVFLVIFFILRKSDLQREKSFYLTRHLLHLILIVSVLTGIVSQWNIHVESLAWINSAVLIISLCFILKSEIIRAFELFGIKMVLFYSYVLTLLPIFMILSSQFISIEIRLSLLIIIALFYSLNSHYGFIRLYKKTNDNKRLERTVLVNSSVIILILLLVLMGLDYTLSIKVSILLFLIALNSLFLSLSLYNRALFYLFMLLASLSALVIKVHINSLSTGFLLVSLVFILYYFIHYLQRNTINKSDKNVLESMGTRSVRHDSPEKLLWFYPVNDSSENTYFEKNSSENNYSEQSIEVNEEGCKNV